MDRSRQKNGKGATKKSGITQASLPCLLPVLEREQSFIPPPVKMKTERWLLRLSKRLMRSKALMWLENPWNQALLTSTLSRSKSIAQGGSPTGKRHPIITTLSVLSVETLIQIKPRERVRERERQREKTVNNKQDKQQKDSGNNRKFKTAKSFFSKKKNKLISKKKKLGNSNYIHVLSRHHPNKRPRKSKTHEPESKHWNPPELATPPAAAPRASFALLCSQHRPCGVQADATAHTAQVHSTKSRTQCPTARK